MTLTDAPLDLALETISSIVTSIDLLEHIKGDGGPPLEPEWVMRARRVLSRAEQKVGGDIRASIASKISGLYVIVDPEATNGRPIIEVAEAWNAVGNQIVRVREIRECVQDLDSSIQSGRDPGH